MILQDSHIDSILERLRAEGLSFAALEDELLDHVCCLVEEELAEGTSFEVALDDAIHSFGDNGIQHVQKETLIAISYKSRLMKQFAFTVAAAFSLLMVAYLGAEAQQIPSLAPVQGEVSSGFGMRKNPWTKVEQHHRGVDFRADTGTPIYATADGEVLGSGIDEDKPAYGIRILIEHGEQISSFYAHLSGVTVAEGDQVKQGDLIGYVGSTGKSTGPHLHFEIRKDGHPVDPMEFIE
ncbi:M23 family metallopeptidase [Pontibacter sp. G13]|uniref:M23 family metallopeptidase n=1 Tax=Pontibacter sp. G13 TaxID=3074898 RepID=UPI00288AE2E0|nr:M23 family metallopeptidase [Pontibacter sp. G13]WNJ16771.1 M23 family metallopeptidase [Pontibacter sp. G13]